MRFDPRNARLWTRTAIATLLTPVKLHERDPALQDTRQQLLAAATASACKKLQITVSLGDGLLIIDELASLMRTIPPPAADYPFRFVLLHLKDPIDVLQQACGHIASCLNDSHKGVLLGSLEVSCPGATEQVAYGNMLSTLLLTADDRSLDRADASEEPSGAMLRVRTPVEYHFASQVCCALMYTRSVRKLSIDWAIRDSDRQHDQMRLMQWITAALFSRKARHAIQVVTLNAFFVDDADMDALEALLQASNPLGVLRGDGGRVGEPPQSLGQVFLAKGTLVELTTPGQIVELGRDYWVDIAFKDTGVPEIYEVLIPGYGLCNVRRSDALSHRGGDQDKIVDHPACHRVKSLTLRFWNECYEESDVRLQQSLCSTHNKPFVVSVALRAKLAFLSAGNSRRSQSTLTRAPGLGGGRAINAFGSDVIARIFEMAARQMNRRVMVTPNLY